MTRKTLLTAVTATLLLLLPAAARAQATQVLRGEKSNEYGLVYTLPMTQLRITVEARCTRTVAGPFASYAKKCIGADNAVTANTTRWQITQVSVAPEGIADTSVKYLMQLKPGMNTFLTVAGDGMLRTVNAELPEQEQEPLVTSRTVMPESNFDPDAYLKYVTADFLSAQSTGRQAQLLADAIMELRTRRQELTMGTADEIPPDGNALKHTLDELAAQEKALMDAFLGHTESFTLTRSYSYLPDKEGRSVLLRVSDFDGLTEADDYAGEPLYISVEVTDRPGLPKDEKTGADKVLPKDAVCYVIPGAARVTLSYRGRNLFDSEMRMAQYGIVFGLNPLLFTDRKNPAYAIFDPATGAVSEIGQVADFGK